MTDLLVDAIVFCLIAYVSYTYIPKPIGVIIAIVAGVIFLIKYLIPLLA